MSYMLSSLFCTKCYMEENWCDCSCSLIKGTLEICLKYIVSFFVLFRRQACVCAVRNAKNKALEVVQMFNQCLGPPVLIREEQYEEFVGNHTEHSDKAEGELTFQQKVAIATVTVIVKIFVIFEIREKSKARKRK